jgi:hypothetical protein
VLLLLQSAAGAAVQLPRSPTSVSIPVASQPGRDWCRNERYGSEKPSHISYLQAEHRNGAVIRSGEYRPRENASSPLGARAGAQPLPHNPRKQRRNPAAAGSGERFRGGKWRRGRA